MLATPLMTLSVRVLARARPGCERDGEHLADAEGRERQLNRIPPAWAPMATDGLARRARREVPAENPDQILQNWCQMAGRPEFAAQRTNCSGGVPTGSSSCGVTSPGQGAFLRTHRRQQQQDEQRVQDLAADPTRAQVGQSGCPTEVFSASLGAVRSLLFDQTSL